MTSEQTGVDGGPAFPTVDANREADYGTHGMTLRDYFAAKAMAAIWPAPHLAEWDKNEIAREAYFMADAMLTARGQP